jgi:hyperosmotically inducible protein
MENKMNDTRHLPSLLAVGAALLLGTATLTNAYAQAEPASEDVATASNQPVTDTWITTKVKAELASTKGVKSTDIDVKTVDGIVTLTGVLPTRTGVRKAVAVTRAVKGVKKVDASGLKAKA